MPRFYLYVPRWVGRAITTGRRAVSNTPWMYSTKYLKYIELHEPLIVPSSFPITKKKSDIKECIDQLHPFI